MVIVQSYFPSYNYQQDKSTYYVSWITLQTALKIAGSNLYCKIILVWLDSSLNVLQHAISKQTQTSLQLVLGVRFTLASQCFIMMYFPTSYWWSNTSVWQPTYNIFTTSYKLVGIMLQTGWKHVANWLELCCKMIKIRLCTDVIFYILVTSLLKMDFWCILTLYYCIFNTMLTGWKCFLNYIIWTLEKRQ